MPAAGTRRITGPYMRLRDIADIDHTEVQFRRAELHGASANYFMVARLAESLLRVSDGPSTKPGLTTSGSQRSYCSLISQARCSAQTFE